VTTTSSTVLGVVGLSAAKAEGARAKLAASRDTPAKYLDFIISLPVLAVGKH
jgi:hypothetical protein